MPAVSGFSSPLIQNPGLLFGAKGKDPAASRQAQEAAPDTVESATSQDTSKNTGTSTGKLDFIRKIKDILREQGAIEGAKQAAAVLAKSPALFSQLAEASPESSMADRLLSILDIAYARFREGYLAKGGEDNTDIGSVNAKASQTTRDIYANFFSQYPLLALQKLPEGLPDLAQAAVASAPADERDALADKLEDLRSQFQDSPDESTLESLKEQVRTALGR